MFISSRHFRDANIRLIGELFNDRKMVVSVANNYARTHDELDEKFGLLKLIGDERATEAGLPKEYSEIEEKEWSWSHGWKRNSEGSLRNVFRKYEEAFDASVKLGLWPTFNPDATDTVPVKSEILEDTLKDGKHVRKTKYYFDVYSYSCMPECLVENLDSLSASGAKNVYDHVEKSGISKVACEYAGLIDGSRTPAGFNTVQIFNLDDAASYDGMNEALTAREAEMRAGYKSKRMARVPILGKIYSSVSEKRIKNYGSGTRDAIESLKQKYAQEVTAWGGIGKA